MNKVEPTKFGTFGGVFTPCTLTILGVIMFLRFGQVMGHAGILYGVVIVLSAALITTLTTLSLSAIATNTRVQGGGAYYLISRSLGVEFGGAIGVVFFLAQAVSVAMYVIGFSEAFVDSMPGLGRHFVAVATLVNVATFVCVFIGAGWTIRIQYGILAILGLALGSFFAGAGRAFDPAHFAANWGPGFTGGETFFSIFALFFPAVTGIMAGANMSGDLRDPARSIPRGTLAAVAATTIVYLVEAVLLASSRERAVLVSNNLILKDVALVPALVSAGVFAATLSSALGSMMGAPRILQAFGRDDVFRTLRFFAVGGGASNEPRRATVLTFAIAQTCILLGDLDAIAPVITMFFMITYGTLNLATFYEAISKNPSYRPTFRYCHWSTSLLGAAGCLAVMLLIDPFWAAVAILLMVALHRYIGRREVESRWGDLQSGLMFERTRRNLLRLEGELYHPKNWRPILLALSGVGWTRPHIPVFGHWLTAGHGILTLAHVVHGEVEDHAERQGDYERALRKFIAKEELQAFPAAVVSRDLAEGVEALIQCHGLGGLRPNTVLLGWPGNEERAESFGATLRLIARLRRSIVIVRMPEGANGGSPDDPWNIPPGTIDVWWRGQDNGVLMLLLAHLLRQNPGWRNKRIRLLRVVENDAATEDVRCHLMELSVASRISVEPIVLVSGRVSEVIQQTSAGATVVLLGFDTPEDGSEIAFFRSLEGLAATLPRILFVRSAGGMELES